MVWYGMVWCGVVWYGMVWYGVPRRAKCKDVPRAKACVARQATRRHMHSDVGADTGDHCGGKGEQAWWVVGERLGAGLECVSGHV